MSKRLLINYSALLLLGLTLLLSCRKKDKKEEKLDLPPEYFGKWTNDVLKVTLNDDKTGSYYYYYSSGASYSYENGSGEAGTKENTLVIGLKKFTINASPSQKNLTSGAFNTYIVLDGDTLYKDPKLKEPCSNGYKDGAETDVDCGGNCKPCPSCTDGIKNQDEEEIDCGGICEACPTCEDGKKNQGETGIDCGGECEPCTTNACNTTLGMGENQYLPNGKMTFTGISADSSGSNFKAEVTLIFSLATTIKQYVVSFYEASFLNMPVNTTQVFTVDYTDDNKANKCQVEMFFQMANMNANPGQKVYVTRLAANSFNIKFCSLVAPNVSPYTLTTKYSANANFSFQ